MNIQNAFKIRKETHDSFARLTVLRLIKAGQSAAQIARILKINPSNAYRRIQALERENLVKKGLKSNFREWVLTERGEGALNELQQVLKGLGDARLLDEEIAPKLRLHFVLLKLPILKTQPEITGIFQKKGAFWTNRRGAIHGWEVKLEGVPVVLTGSSVLIYPKHIWAQSVSECVKICFDLMERIKAKLQVWAPYLQFTEKTEICRQHLALNGGFASLIPEGYKYQSDRLTIDYSLGPCDFEAIHPKFATEDMHKIMALVEGFIRGEYQIPRM